MPDDLRRCILVGMGGVSRIMLKALVRRPWYQTAAVVDVREEALGEAAEMLSLPEGHLYKDLSAALSNCRADLAIINTPSELHYEQTRASLEAGLDVLVAKPFTNNFEQAVELILPALSVGLDQFEHRHDVLLDAETTKDRGLLR